ncbi:hypothetical protein K0C01_06415 [Salinarchaeum sp. IM2453]|uniref:DUF7500 family protein n=1 Tax=Salinarchaeum sp. IM2453 TaxID=2862870 RepID=UPI001C83580C|nr:hypothetical protein [Salinarchaeum sp. IM2453]QZA87460.1 hypothetical protein K0C01_06415 [Salinarchaeum sp. IM2453]
MSPPGNPDPDEEGVLSPDELRLSEKEEVEEIEEGRYVVSTDGSKPDVPEKAVNKDKKSEQRTHISRDSKSSTASKIGEANIESQVEAELRDIPTEFGYRISVKYGDSVDHHRLYADDVTTTFNNLLAWYAKNLDSEMSPGEVLGILLSESDVSVQYPVKSFEQYLVDNGLSTDDTIADLLITMREDGAFNFPPQK